MNLKSDSLPRDCTCLPLTRGTLLVSPGHAVFCRISPGETVGIQSVLASKITPNQLSPALRYNLDAHGFFAPPRPAKADPPTVQLQLTNSCNLSCAYCCTNSGRPRLKEVTFAQMLQVVREIPQALGAGTGVAILGGEPLLVPWALDLAAEVVKLGLPLTLFTNGIPLANGQLAEKFARLDHQSVKVRVSLSGPTSTTCDALAGASRYEAALRGIQRLSALGCQVTVDLMFTPQQVEAIARELPGLRQRLPPHTPLTFGVLYLSGRETGQHLFSSRQDLETALDQVAFEAGETIPASRTSPTAYRREGCNCALGKHIHVRSDGALFNCFKMEEKVGHIDTLGFTNTARWAQDHPHQVQNLPACTSCPLATLCGGGCRSENLLYSGNPDQPPCGPWRVRVLSELLAEDRTSAIEWPVAFLLQEARRRGIDAPADLLPIRPSRHLVEV